MTKLMLSDFASIDEFMEAVRTEKRGYSTKNLWSAVIVATCIGLAVLLVTACAAFAEQQYNVMEDRWETVPDNSDWSPKYNAMEDTWSIQPDDAKIEYNVMEDKWEWDSGKNEYNCKQEGE